MKIRGRRALKRAALGANRVLGPAARKVGINTKEIYEYAFWKSRALEEKTLGHSRYEAMFTTHIGFDREFYAGKRILDVGCGPRGSLEWADHAAERVGLDSLADRYRKLGIDQHRMQYVSSGAESIPFDDGHFDVVTSFNALDHVEDVDRSLNEMLRVLAPGGTIVIVVDIHTRPTVAEPHAIPWTLAEQVDRYIDIVDERHVEKPAGRDFFVEQIPFDHDDPTERYGVLFLRGVRRPTPVPSSQ